MNGFSDERRRKLQLTLEHAIGSEEAERLIEELEGPLPDFRAAASESSPDSGPGNWLDPEPTPDDRKVIQTLIAGAEHFHQRLMGAVGTQALMRLETELVRQGLTPRPDTAYVKSEWAKQGTPEEVAAMQLLAEQLQGKETLTELEEIQVSRHVFDLYRRAAITQSHDQMQRKERPVEFLRALSYDLRRLYRVADAMLAEKGKPRVTGKRMIADAVAQRLNLHGVPVRTTRPQVIAKWGKDKAFYWRTLLLVYLDAGFENSERADISDDVKHGCKTLKSKATS